MDISSFIAKFNEIKKTKDNKIDIILESINKFTNIVLKKEDIEIFDQKFKIKSSYVIKNEINMHKKEIEEFLFSKKIYLKIIQ